MVKASLFIKIFLNKLLSLYFWECNLKASLFFLFKGHFGDEYPWHTETLNALVNKLETLSQFFDKNAIITLRNRELIWDLKSYSFHRDNFFDLLFIITNNFFITYLSKPIALEVSSWTGSRADWEINDCYFKNGYPRIW